MLPFLLSNSDCSSTLATENKITLPSGLPVALFQMALLVQNSETHSLNEDPSVLEGEESVQIFEFN